MAGAAIGLGAAGPAHAGATMGISVTVTDAVPGACTDGVAEWRVAADVQVDNLRAMERVYQRTDFDMHYSVGGEDFFQTNVTVVRNDGFVAGNRVAANQSNEHPVEIRASLPCDADQAELYADIKVEDDRRRARVRGPLRE